VAARVDGAPAADVTFRDGALPKEVRVTAPGAKAAKLDVQVDGYFGVNDPPDARALTRLANTFFVPRQSKLLRLRLESRCVMLAPPGGVAGPVCTAPQTCIGGQCADSAVPVALLEPYTSDWPTGGSDVCKPPNGGPPQVIVGTGQTDYLPITEGQTLQLEAGPQGGHHLWIAVRMRNLKQAGSITTLRASQPGGVTVQPAAYVFTFDRDEGGFCKLYGLRFQLDTNGVDYHAFLGKPLDLSVEVKDRSGAIGTGEAHVNVDPTIR
jgi:hypothetical protein